MAEETLKRISCDPQCGFMIQSHDEQEMIEIAKKHVRDKHNMDITEEDLKARMSIVG